MRIREEDETEMNHRLKVKTENAQMYESGKKATAFFCLLRLKSYSSLCFDFLFLPYSCKGLSPNLARISFHSPTDFSPPPPPPPPPPSAAAADEDDDEPPPAFAATL